MKRIVCLITALAFVFGVCGCGASTSTDETSTTAAVSETESTAVVSEQPTEPEPASSEVEVSAADEDAEAPETAEETAKDLPISQLEFQEVTLPITEETTTFSFWYGHNPQSTDYITSMADNLVFQTMAERTNIDFEFLPYSPSVQADTYGLVLASEDYPDIMVNGANLYTAGREASIDDEIFLELSDLIDEYVPNYKLLIDNSDELRKEVTTDNGYFTGFYCVDSEPNEVSSGLVIRKDLLDSLNLELPTTIDEYESVLTALNTEYGGVYLLPSDGISSMISAYDITAGLGDMFSTSVTVYQKDGVVHCGLVEDEFLAYLTLMHSWYERGLIYNDFVSETQVKDVDVDMMTNKNVVLFSSNADHVYDVISSGQEFIDGFELSATYAPSLEAGGVTHFGEYPVVAESNNDWNISATCEAPEILCQYINYWYSEEGSLLANWGVENVTFEYDENGEPRFTDLIVNNPDGMTTSIAMYKYTYECGPFVMIGDREYSSYSDEKIATIDACVDIWEENTDSSYVMPTVAMTSEEGAIYDDIIGDIVTYTQESILKFIVGDLDLSEFDTFVNNLYSYGIQDIIDVQQSAYDRYVLR
jgi:putative aldouronate transport system substrate-binding protein